MDIFAFKKLISPLLSPFPLVMFALLAAVALLWRRKPTGHGRTLASLSTLTLVLLSTGPLANWSARTLENDYPAHPASAHPDSGIRWIVVLAGGVRVEPDLPLHDRLAVTTLSRLVEGIRLLNLYPDARLLLSGGGKPSAASLMRDSAVGLGVALDRIALEEQSRDTKDQADNLANMVGADRFCLVTSANHMPRSMALFQARGLDPLAAPTEFLSTSRPRNAWDYVPSPGRLSLTHDVAHEYLGLLWAGLRGQL